MSDNDLWYVKTADGDVNRMTLDQLDAAFNAGDIDDSAMVLPAGEQTWVKLSELLGGGDEGQPPADAAPAPAAAAVQPAPAVQAPIAPAPAAVPPVVSVPVAMPAPAVHAPAVVVAPAPVVALPQSLRPVSVDLSGDVDEAMFKKKSRKGMVIGAMVGVLALGGVAFGAVRGASHDDTTSAAAAPPAPPPVTAEPTPPPPPTPSPQPTSTMAPLPDHGLSDDQKARLAAQDKAREDKSRNRKSRGGGAAPSHGSKGKSQAFTSGGNKFDPLNGSL